MARVTVTEDETAEGILPPVCLVCGADAPTSRPIMYRWAPWWTNLVLPLGVLPWAVLRFILSRSLLVHTPLCSRHGRYWEWRAAVVPVGVLFSFGFLMLGWALVDDSHRVPPSWTLLASFGALVMTVVAWLIMRRRGVRVRVVTSRSVSFVGAAERFVAVVEAGRADYEQQNQAWKARLQGY